LLSDATSCKANIDLKNILDYFIEQIKDSHYNFFLEKDYKPFFTNNNMPERLEAFMRIPVAIVTGIILYLWGYLIVAFIVINFVYTIFSGRRLKELADLSEVWNTQSYVLKRYLVFESNKRPFPFTSLEKSMSKFGK